MAKELGYVAANWAAIEGRIAYLIATAIGTNAAIGDAVTAEISALQKLNLLTVLLNLTGNAAWIDHWADLSAEIDQARMRRNELLHSIWDNYEDSHTIIRHSAKGRLKVVRLEVDLDEVAAFAKTLLGISARLKQFYRVVSISLNETLVASTSPFEDRSRNPIPAGPAPDRTPSRRSQEMEAARQAKRAKKASDRQRSARKESP